MWPETSNSKVKPPPVRKMLGRPGKKRKKELREVITTSQASASSKRSGKQKSHPTQAVQQSQSSEPSQAIVQSDIGNRKGANNAFKRPKVVGHGVFVSKDDFICAEEDNFNIKVLCLDRRTSSHKFHHKVQQELKVFRDDVADFSCGSNYF
ncbi:hypothetical protein MTR67_028607 [Solanum verrucosum]|uniref:Uncharacterized protein n=1 Tax=Solanum verrucosum TaxID=315347 RepID=A0AAF0R7H7_SOLVR|nr:hypothetical protein MTR67_028607 [Solanum verrucosum]